MSYKDKELLRDKNGNPIPQVYDQATDSFKPAPVVQSVTDNEVLAELKVLTAIITAGGLGSGGTGEIPNVLFSVVNGELIMDYTVGQSSNFTLNNNGELVVTY